MKLGKPVVYGSILGFEGQATVFRPSPGFPDPCYRCLYPEPPKTHVPNCAEFGTLGGIAGLIGSVQAIEVCKLALGPAHCAQHGLETLVGKLWWLDARTLETRLLTLRKKPDCPLCSIPPETISLVEAAAPACSTTSRLPALTLDDLAQRRERGQVFYLLDVRQPGEWARGHLPDAHLIPLSDLLNDPEHLPRLRPFPEVLVYCQMGLRSQSAVAYLRERGINARNLNVDWSSAEIRRPGQS